MPSRSTNSNSNLDVIKNDIGYIRDDVKEIKATLTHTYVTKDEFEPIKKVVYGLVGLILVAVVGTLISLVVQK